MFSEFLELLWFRFFLLMGNSVNCEQPVSLVNETYRTWEDSYPEVTASFSLLCHLSLLSTCQ